jgi:hypothetical protein
MDSQMMDSQLEMIYNKVNELSDKCNDKYIFIEQFRMLIHKTCQQYTDIPTSNRIDEFIIMFMFINLNIQYLFDLNLNIIISSLENSSNTLLKHIMVLHGDPNLDIIKCPRYLRDMAFHEISKTKNLLTLHIESLH